MNGDALLGDLGAIVGTDHAFVDDVGTYSVDWTKRFGAPGAVVVRPGSVDEVVAVVDWCRARSVAVVPQGGNTGLVGGGVPLDGEIVLSTRRLDAIGPVDAVSRQMTVGSGATLAAVQMAAEEAGLRYAVDFGARGSATIGGTVATNAGGVNVLRYGMTRRQVVGLEAVLGDGCVFGHLSGLEKDNTGFDLVSLLCGSEGTLGIVTAARIRLVPRASHVSTSLVGFATMAAAVRAVGVIRSGTDSLDAAELMLDSGARLVGEAFGVGRPFDAPVYVLIEASADHDPSEQIEMLLSGCEGVTDVAVAVDARTRRDLWRLRDEHTAAIGTKGVPRKFDVTVPVGALAEFIEAVTGRVSMASPASETFVFGHVADGNMHVNVLGGDDDEVIEETVLGLVLEHGGSVSAEHGVGRLKKAWMPRQRSTVDLDLMRAIKRACDPGLFLNPHVLLDTW